MKKKTIKIILIASVIVAILAALAFHFFRKEEKKAATREIVSLLVVNKEKLAEITTYRYSRDTVFFETESPTGLRSIFSSKPDTVAVFLVRPTICAGIDLRNLSEEDFSIRNDTLFVSLPAPVILDTYLNHSDISIVYSAKGWKMDTQLSVISEKAKSDLRRDALRQGILAKAATKAERSLSDFLGILCQMPVQVRCVQSPTVLADQ